MRIFGERGGGREREGEEEEKGTKESVSERKQRDFSRVENMRRV